LKGFVPKECEKDAHCDSSPHTSQKTKGQQKFSQQLISLVALYYIYSIYRMLLFVISTLARIIAKPVIDI